MNPEKADASIGQLFGALATDTSALVRQELQLASAEMTAKARHAARNAGMVAAGGVLLHLSGVAALVCVLAALQPLLPLWAAAGIVAVLLAIISVLTMQAGLRALRDIDPVPEETLNTLRPDRATSGG
jgi:uncharacterized membrane protein YqjE